MQPVKIILVQAFLAPSHWILLAEALYREDLLVSSPTFPERQSLHGSLAMKGRCCFPA